MRTFLIAAAACAVTGPALAQTTTGMKADLDRSFAAMDANKDGKIDRAEYDRYIAAKIDRQNSAFDAGFKALDKNGDGQLSRDEAAASPPIASSFDALDSDRNGSLSLAEMRAALAKSQSQQIGGE
jgi:Ca2+-binding EF-hand superfamily protein